MADAFVSFALQKLGDFLIHEVSLLTSLRDEITWLRNELLFMQSFLKDAEQKQSRDHRVQQWVFEINSIANDAVSILETYSFETGKGDDGFASCLKACACICRKEKKFNHSSNESWISLANERLMSLVEASSPFYGMGGLGKTTLARKLYISPNIAFSFPTRAWICVSQEYNTMDLLRNIIKSIQGRTKETLDLLERMTEGDLEIYLCDLLKERKYLVVVDDVWQKEAWESLKRAFPDSKNGSRVINTTRKEDVAERADDRGFVHKLCFLCQEESWDLFCRKLVDVRAMIPAMESLAKDMVEKCRGLPLAIVVLSGLLSHKKGAKRMAKEDQVIDAEDIIPRGEERMEDVAEDFLNVLIRRSLVQVEKIFLEKVTKCRVHDLLRDLAIQKASDTNLFDIYHPRKHSISSSCIRLAIHSQGEKYHSLDLSNLKLSISSKIAKQKQCGDQRVQQWVFEMNSIANDVVAILKTYNFEVGKSDDIGFASCLKKYILQCRQDAKEIQSLKQRIMDISRKRETYGITWLEH
uniref:EDNR2GH5 protein n=1 Tax=Solanum tuberosum TaxID=4113 RepID=M1ATP4_SOLTU